MKMGNPAPSLGTSDSTMTKPPRCPLGLVIWASRIHLAARISGQPEAASQLAKTLKDRHERRVLEALARVWDTMLFTTEERYVLHEPDCACLSLHEQAVITALRCLQKPSSGGFVSAMSSVLPPTAVRLIRPDMQGLADALSRLERHRFECSEKGSAASRELYLAYPPQNRRLH